MALSHLVAASVQAAGLIILKDQFDNPAADVQNHFLRSWSESNKTKYLLMIYNNSIRDIQPISVTFLARRRFDADAFQACTQKKEF